ncbi:hypothetical protein ES319_D10G035100v1 [Gossypium barbadense]|uniref:Uncharacterized protein n=1 Tax=Gossypium barbadense TaxID=3634 RepID=A0A5J5PNP6_GOSBA|nr:hypothetical protein ES319_D10G035100v1 [Gossypium barbadense]PPD78453.1 hypothetical protein GOBAR_DD24647 [Gossypium barbadense]
MVLGNDDSKSQDEGDTYGGDVGSPASQDDHNHHHRFNREEERERAPSPVESHATMEKSVDKVTRDAESREKCGQVFSYSSSPPAEASNVTEKTQDSESHDHSKKQPLVASTPPAVQTTSFLSCCGLFDVLTGSGR